MDIERNHDVVAWGHWLTQFQDSPRLESVVRGLYWGMNEAAKTASQLYMDRWLDTAIGKQLDGIGEIVGQSRIILAGDIRFFGFQGQTNSGGFSEARFRREWESGTGGMVALLDDDYRRLLRWKIAVNKGTGTAPDIAEAINAIFSTQNTRVIDVGNANIEIVVDVQLPEDNPLIVNKEQWVPAAAGVGFVFIGFRQEYYIISEDDDYIVDEDGNRIIGEFFATE